MTDLRVLVVHNRYRSAFPSGENRVVDADVAQLRERGVEVVTHFRSSDELGGFGPVATSGVPLRPIWSPADSRAVARAIEQHRPDVVHLHNPYPLISPAVIRTARRRGVPIVQTVHNYRHSCANGLHLREGKVCTDCVGRRVAIPAVQHGCYRGSRLQSAAFVAAETIHRGSWRMVDRFFALSEFMASRLALGGIPCERIVVKPNSVDDPGPPADPGTGFLFAGRLEPAKGVRLLLDAWECSGLDGTLPLVIAGDGELRDEVERRAALARSVEYAGPLDRTQIEHRFRACAAVVVPSRWFEGPPTIILESYAHGRPVVATRMGSLVEAVGDRVGWLADPDPISLGEALRVAAPPSSKGVAAREEYERRYRPDVVTDQLMNELLAVAR